MSAKVELIKLDKRVYMEKKYKIISDIIRTKHEYLKELNEIVGKAIA